MIDLEPLKIYFNNPGETIHIDKYYFNVRIEKNDDESFSINIKVRQQDTKEEHIIQFRVGLKKQKKKDESIHNPEIPHFELDFYKVDERSFAATLYFEFNNPTNEELVEYAKGTVVIITRMLKNFFDKYGLDLEKLSEIISEELVFQELGSSEPILIDALYECYKNSSLIVKQKNKERIVITTEHNLKKFLNFDDLMPIYLPLLQRIKKK